MPTGRSTKKANVRKKGPARKIAKPVKRKGYRDVYAHDAQRDKILKARVPLGVRPPVPFAPWAEFYANMRPFLIPGDREQIRLMRQLKARAPDYYFVQ